MKNKVSWATAMQQNLEPKIKKSAFLNGFKNLSQAAELAEELKLYSLAETLTSLIQKGSNV